MTTSPTGGDKSHTCSSSPAPFSWKSLGDVEKGRPNLGSTAPVFVYRLLLYTLQATLKSEFGADKTDDLIRRSGHLAGREFCANMLDTSLEFGPFLSSLQKCLKDNAIGILRMEDADFDTGIFTVTVAEDLDCSGLPLTNEVVCKYDEGFLAGVLEAYTGKLFRAREIDCWASGDRVCRFAVERLAHESGDSI